MYSIHLPFISERISFLLYICYLGCSRSCSVRKGSGYLNDMFEVAVDYCPFTISSI